RAISWRRISGSASTVTDGSSRRRGFSTSPRSPPVQVMTVTWAPSRTYLAVDPAPLEDSSSGCAWTATIRRGSSGAGSWTVTRLLGGDGTGGDGSHGLGARAAHGSARGAPASDPTPPLRSRTWEDDAVRRRRPT